MPDKDNKKGKYFKKMFRWENKTIDPHIISYLDTSEVQNTKAELGVDFLFTVYLMFHPFRFEFRYTTEELRDKKKLEFEDYLKKVGIRYIDELNIAEGTDIEDSDNEDIEEII